MRKGGEREMNIDEMHANNEIHLKNFDPYDCESFHQQQLHEVYYHPLHYYMEHHFQKVQNESTNDK